MKILVGILMLTSATSFAQELSKDDSLKNEMSLIKSDIAFLKKFKLSGYMQGQYQVAQKTGAQTYEGGNFSSTSDKRFMLRRARFKLNYLGNNSEFVFQFDASDNGTYIAGNTFTVIDSVGTVKGTANYGKPYTHTGSNVLSSGSGKLINAFNIKEMYYKFTEPWLKTFSLSVGNMNRPFGYEIGYSSSNIESPERGRMSQILFPNEYDMGAMLTVQAPNTSIFNFIKINAGMYNGTSSGYPEYDSKKDFIGQIVLSKSIKEKLKLSGGFSYYNGGWRAGTLNVYKMSTDTKASDGATTVSQKAFQLNAISSLNNFVKREDFGAEAQVSYESPIGITTLRGEYIWGTNPGVAQVQNSSDIYIRKFNGAYLYFIQNILKSKNDIVVKYDWYDPNTDVAAGDYGKSTLKYSTGFKAIGASDIKYTTIGIGWVYHWDQNLKITAYYDLVRNEKNANLSTTLVNGEGLDKDLKDDVFTLRIQYKF